MTLPASITGKIAVILPRLGSDHDGEIVASVKAIERTLATAGADWQDLTAAFERGALALEPPPSRKPSEAEPDWEDLTRDDRIEWIEAIKADQWALGDLSDWERRFLLSIRGQLAAWRSLSDKQTDVLNRIFAKAWSWGVRP